MSRNGKIILSAAVAIAAISVLFAIVTITDTFIASYVFAIIAICGIAGAICVYSKGSSRALGGLSYIYTSVVYAVLNVIFSVFACIKPFTLKWTLSVHVILLLIFVIRIIALNIGSDYVNEVDKRNEIKHRTFLNEKKDYWK